MKTIKFLRTVVVDDYRKGTKDEESYKDNQTVKLSDSAADHWINRGAAEEITEAEAPKRGRPPRAGSAATIDD